MPSESISLGIMPGVDDSRDGVFYPIEVSRSASVCEGRGETIPWRVVATLIAPRETP